MRLPFKGSFIFTQDFGVNPQYYAKFLVLYPDGNRYPMSGHNGLDFATPHRTEIVAPHHGKVIEALSDPTGYGFYVKMENNTEGSVIAHLDSIDVRTGFELKEGDHIGWSDNTGNSTGPHCHWGYYRHPRDRSNGIAGFIDQKPFLKEAGITLIPGQLPIIQTATIGQAIDAKGLDLSNNESLQVVIDTWHDVANGKYKSTVEYQALEVQVSELRRQLEETQKMDENVSVDLKNYNELKALGYNTIDDISKVLKAKDDSNLALQTENAQVRKRNSTLADMVREMEEEDHTTAELGQNLISENKIYKNAIKEVAQISGAEKPTIDGVISTVFSLKDQVDRFLSGTGKVKPVKVKAPQTKTPTDWNYIFNIFGLDAQKKEVK